MNKKLLKSGLSTIGWIGAISALLGFILILFLLYLTIKKGFDSVQCWWQVLYYSFAVLGSVGTVIAVYVALNKEQLNRVLYSPELRFEKSTVSPQPSFRTNSNNNLVEKYSQYITISNSSQAEARECTVDIISISFDKNHKQKLKEINGISQQTIKINGEDGIISKAVPVKMLLFEVYNPNADSSPQSQIIQTASIRFNGIDLSQVQTSMGRYRIKYRLRCNNGHEFYFEVEVDWIGEWSDEQNEMVDKFDTKIIK